MVDSERMSGCSPPVCAITAENESFFDSQNLRTETRVFSGMTTKKTLLLKRDFITLGPVPPNYEIHNVGWSFVPPASPLNCVEKPSVDPVVTPCTCRECQSLRLSILNIFHVDMAITLVNRQRVINKNGVLLSSLGTVCEYLLPSNFRRATKQFRNQIRNKASRIMKKRLKKASIDNIIIVDRHLEDLLSGNSIPKFGMFSRDYCPVIDLDFRKNVFRNLRNVQSKLRSKNRKYFRRLKEFQSQCIDCNLDPPIFVGDLVVNYAWDTQMREFVYPASWSDVVDGTVKAVPIIKQPRSLGRRRREKRRRLKRRLQRLELNKKSIFTFEIRNNVLVPKASTVGTSYVISIETPSSKDEVFVAKEDLYRMRHDLARMISMSSTLYLNSELLVSGLWKTIDDFLTVKTPVFTPEVLPSPEFLPCNALYPDAFRVERLESTKSEVLDMLNKHKENLEYSMYNNPNIDLIDEIKTLDIVVENLSYDSCDSMSSFDLNEVQMMGSLLNFEVPPEIGAAVSGMASTIQDTFKDGVKLNVSNIPVTHSFDFSNVPLLEQLLSQPAAKEMSSTAGSSATIQWFIFLASLFVSYQAASVKNPFWRATILALKTFAQRYFSTSPLLSLIDALVAFFAFCSGNFSNDPPVDLDKNVTMGGFTISNGLFSQLMKCLTGFILAIVMVKNPSTDDILSYLKRFKDFTPVVRGVEDAFEFLLKTTNEICSFVGDKVNIDCLREMDDSYPGYTALEKKVQEFVCFMRSGAELNHDNNSKLRSLESELRSMLNSLPLNNPRYRGYRDNVLRMISDLKRYITLFDSEGLHVTQRKETLGVLFCGPTAVGKSAQLRHFQNTISARVMSDEMWNVAKENLDDTIYAFMPELEFYDGYHGQFHTFFDELGQLKSVAGLTNDGLLAIMRMINNICYPLHQASLDKKGRSFFCSRVVWATTNLKFIDPDALECSEAFCRRFKPCTFLVVPKLEYATPASLALYKSTHDRWDLRFDFSKVKLDDNGDVVFIYCDYFYYNMCHDGKAKQTNMSARYSDVALSMDQVADIIVNEYKRLDFMSEAFQKTDRKYVDKLDAARKQRSEMKVAAKAVEPIATKVVKKNDDIRIAHAKTRAVLTSKFKLEDDKRRVAEHHRIINEDLPPHALGISKDEYVSAREEFLATADPWDFLLATGNEVQMHSFNPIHVSQLNTASAMSYDDLPDDPCPHETRVHLATDRSPIHRTPACVIPEYKVRAICRDYELPFIHFDKYLKDQGARLYADSKDMVDSYMSEYHSEFAYNLMVSVESHWNSFLDFIHNYPVISCMVAAVAAAVTIFGIYKLVNSFKKDDGMDDTDLDEDFNDVVHSGKTKASKKTMKRKLRRTKAREHKRVDMKVFDGPSTDHFTLMTADYNITLANATDTDPEVQMLASQFYKGWATHMAKMDNEFNQKAAKVYNNSLFRIDLRVPGCEDSVQGYCLAIVGGMFAMPAHYYDTWAFRQEELDEACALKGLPSIPLELTFTRVQDSYNFTFYFRDFIDTEDKPTVYWPYLDKMDLCYWHLKGICNQVSSIIDYMPREGDPIITTKYDGAVLKMFDTKYNRIVPGGQKKQAHHIYSVLGTKITPYKFGMPGQDQVATSESGTEYMNDWGYEYTYYGLKGECGFAIFSADVLSPPKLMGIHVAGNIGTKRGFAAPFVQEKALEAANFFGISNMKAPIKDGDNVTMLNLGSNFTAIKQVANMFPPMKNKVCHSVLYGYRPSKYEASALRDFKNAAGEWVSPMNLARSNYCVNHRPINMQLLKDCTLSYINKSMAISDFGPWDFPKIFSIKEAIIGIPGIWPGIPKSTSAGFDANKGEPYYKSTKLKGKRDWFGAFEYDLSGDKFDELVSHLESQIALLKGGNPIFEVYLDTLKDERRKIPRVLEGKTRLVSACSMPLLILMRMYFGDFVRWTMMNHTRNGCAVGVNVHGDDWAGIVRTLHSIGEAIIAGDFKNWDGSLTIAMLYAALDVIEAYYYNSNPEERLIRKMLFLTITQPYHVATLKFVLKSGEVVTFPKVEDFFESGFIASGIQINEVDTVCLVEMEVEYEVDIQFMSIVYQWHGGMSSGSFLTTIVNSIVNNIVCRYVVVDYLTTDRGGAMCYRTDWNFDFGFLEANSCYIMFGDDNLLSFSEFIPITHEDMAICFARIGLTYTDEDKSGKVRGRRTIHEVTFLKRLFRWIRTRCVAPLDLDVLHEMSQWSKTDEQIGAMAATVRTNVQEYSYWGPSVFDTDAGMLIKAATPHGLAPLDISTWARAYASTFGLETQYL